MTPIVHILVGSEVACGLAVADAAKRGNCPKCAVLQDAALERGVES